VPTRHTTEFIIFRHAFAVPSWLGLAPTGTYVVDTEEALIEGLSFPAYCRTSTTITWQAIRQLLQTIAIDPEALAAARAMDRATDIPASA